MDCRVKPGNDERNALPPSSLAPSQIKIDRHALPRRALRGADIARRRGENVLPRLPGQAMRRAIEGDRFRQARIGIAAAAPVAPAVLVLAAPPQAQRVAITLLLPRLLGGKSRGISHARGDRFCCLCCRLAQCAVSFPVFPPPLRGRAGRGVSSLRGAIATKQSRAELGPDCFAPLRGARNDDIKSRSRGAPSRPAMQSRHGRLRASAAIRRNSSAMSAFPPPGAPSYPGVQNLSGRRAQQLSAFVSSPTCA